MIEILAVYSFTKNVFYKKINFDFLVNNNLTNDRAFFTCMWIMLYFCIKIWKEELWELDLMSFYLIS